MGGKAGGRRWKWGNISPSQDKESGSCTHSLQINKVNGNPLIMDFDLADDNDLANCNVQHRIPHENLHIRMYKFPIDSV